MPAQSPRFETMRDQVKIVLKVRQSVYAAVRFAITFRQAANAATAPPCPWCFVAAIGQADSTASVVAEPAQDRYRCTRCGKALDSPSAAQSSAIE
jgi:hypothetical protein